MLSCLKIENIAVIKETEVETDRGFNVLTGETGAGKSIIIDAINAVMGRRTSKELIRTGYDKASVSALFTDVNTCVRNACEGYGIDAADGELLLQRNMSSDGKNICRINGQPVNLATLREVCEHLVNIHGQHDNQQLLNSENHCGYIDSFADNGREREEYLSAFNELKELKKQLRELYKINSDKITRMDALQYAVGELEAADIKPGEIEKLKLYKQKAANSEKLRNELKRCFDTLNGDVDNDGVITSVSTVAANIARLGDMFSMSKELSEKLYSFQYELQAIADTVGKEYDDMQFSPEELEKADERLDMYYNLTKKYGKTEEELLRYLASAKEELEKINTADEQIAVLEEKSEKAEEKLVSAGKKLTGSRKIAGERFADEIRNVLQYLQMPSVRFLVSCEQGTYTKNGCDNIEFLISANKGEEPKPLVKIASGGEMSRIMLAIKSVLLSADTVDTLIFDEIDSGISGYAAGKVGNKLKELSHEKQVICITHLAQIAALADCHLLIEKTENDKNTFTSVKRLEGDTRIREIARIMSGVEMTENLYNSAKELLDKGVNQ